MQDTFLTLAEDSQGLYKEKGSRFISFAMPVSSTEDVKAKLQVFKKNYYDARHICYAYVLGKNGTVFRSNDDGEPSGTAGKPILGQINSKDLTNVLVVVVRYFGGILLGTGGLVIAYREAAADAIQNNKIVTRLVESNIAIQFSYESMNDVMRIVKENSLTITSQHLDTKCFMSFKVRESFVEQLKENLHQIEGVSLLFQ